MDSHTPNAIEQFARTMANWPDFEGESLGFFSASIPYTLTTFSLEVAPFVSECMEWAKDARGPTSPGSPSDISSLTLVSQESEKMVGPAYTVSAQERTWYYYGITNDGGQPELLYRTSWEKCPWLAPTGRLARPPTKFARPVHNTPLNRVWDTVGPLVDDLVNATIKRGYAINTARFFTVPNGEDVKKGTLGPVVIWITVYPDSTSADTAHKVSQDILRLLADNGVYGVDMEWCEGITLRLVGPPLLSIVGKRDPTVVVHRHLTTALSIPIAPAEGGGKDRQGTGGFYFHENLDKNGNPSNKVLLVTNHHVLCKQDDKEYDFRADSSPRQKVRVCGSRRFQQGLEEIKAEVVNHTSNINACNEEITELKMKMKMAKGDEDEDDTKNLKDALRELDDHQAAIAKLNRLYSEFNVNWGDITRRNIGVLEYSPPMSIDVDNQRYTQDWATIRLDEAKFRPNFKGNVIDLGNLPASEFKRLMHLQADVKPVTSNGLLRVRGFVTKGELAQPESLDIEGEPCLVVLKDGCTSDLTFGLHSGLESFLREDGTGARSMEVAIFNYGNGSKPFSSKGDSGSLIVNSKGEMVGLLHSGGPRDKMWGSKATYVTYATPAWRLCEWIKQVYPNADFARETW